MSITVWPCPGSRTTKTHRPWDRFKQQSKLSVPAKEHSFHDDVMKWKHFLRYLLFVRVIHRSPVNSPHKGQYRRALIFSLICALNKGRVNNREAGDLRRHRAHYDVIVMIWLTTLGVVMRRFVIRTNLSFCADFLSLSLEICDTVRFVIERAQIACHTEYAGEHRSLDIDHIYRGSWSESEPPLFIHFQRRIGHYKYTCMKIWPFLYTDKW